MTPKTSSRSGPSSSTTSPEPRGKELDTAKELLKKTEDAIKRSKLPGKSTILYGDVLIVDRLGKASIIGLYRDDEDKVYVKAISRIKHNHLVTLLHELGHRYWMKTLGREIKQAWRRHHEDVGQGAPSGEVIIPKVGEHFPFAIKGRKRNPPKVEKIEGDRFIIDGGKAWIERRDIIQLQTKNNRMKAYPSIYASTDAVEHFCESFGMYLAGTLQPEHVEAFETILGIKKEKVQEKIVDIVVQEAPPEPAPAPPAPEPVPEPPPTRKPPRSPLWGVTALFGPNPKTDRYHVALFESFEEATDYVKEAGQEGWKGVLVKRVTGPAAIAQAQKEADTFMDRIDNLQMY